MMFFSRTRVYPTSVDVSRHPGVWHVDVLATSLVMCAIHTMHDVVSRLLEVNLGRRLEVVIRRCLPLWEYSKMLMRCHMM